MVELYRFGSFFDFFELNRFLTICG